MIDIKLAKKLSKIDGFMEKCRSTVLEAVDLLRWNEDDCSLILEIKIDEHLPLGNGRVSHDGVKHIIRLHPHPDHSFPWNTVRHEALHSLIKTKMSVSHFVQECEIGLPDNYRGQTFRDNLEEYFVRCLNAIHISETEGKSWYRKQINHDRNSGFTRIIEFSGLVERWYGRHISLKENTFAMFIDKLNNKKL
ncbi:MAG: hypothetical protein WC497_02595 [Patescibacteria group bacterium]